MHKPSKAFLYRLLSSTRQGQKMFFCPKLHRYLSEIGWIRSKVARMPMDRSGNPLPWFTYPSIAFLDKRVKPDMSIFEYGSGNSTLWWSKKAARVVSCEHHEEWFGYFKDLVPANVEYVYRALQPGGDYSKSILESEGEFDIVVIDGRDRVNCAKSVLPKLHERGVIVWDNSNREKYEEGYSYLIDNGFRRLDFEGLAPINTRASCTSVFYRDNNCLGI